MLRFASLTSAAALTALLAACGGGGGGGDAATTPAIPANAANPAPGAVEEDVAAFQLLNAERSRCGFGTLTRNPSLDAAARAHADYQAFHGIVDHLENASTMPVGFTGALPSERVIAKGYAPRLADIGPVADEITALIGTSDKAGLGTSGVRSLLNAPYHLRGLMGGYRDVGMAVRSNTDVGSSRPAAYLQINAAYLRSAGEQPFPAADVRTYPCEGVTGVNFRLTNESPNPVPNRDLAVNPLGASVLVAVRPGNRLVVSSATFTQVSTDQRVATRAPIGGSNDPVNPDGRCAEGCFTLSEAYIAADGPLQPNTAYRVNLAGTNNGVAFTRQFTFTTGTGG
jgi:hypothetical protein